MKKHLLLVMSGIFLLFVSCSKADMEANVQDEAALKSASVVKNFTAHLSGDQEVPPNATLAQGQAIFKLSKDGSQLSYKLIVANLDDIQMAHIHLAPAGSNGMVVAWLYPSAPPARLIPGTTSGILAEGVITSANLVGPLAGQTLAKLIQQIEAGNAYVNVHTKLIPAGEIRGQIK